jgi:mannose-1-phosphate guanylyltransferase
MADRVDVAESPARSSRDHMLSTDTVSPAWRTAETPCGTVAAIVLAGSYRRALDPSARFLRDPLLPIAQLPLISFPIEWLDQSGVTDEIMLCAGDSTADVRQHFATAPRRGGPELRFYKEDHPRGPAGCARDAAALTSAQTIVVLEGSLLPALDLRELLASHASSGAPVTTVVEVERRRQLSNRPRLPGGIYVFDRRVLEAVAPRGFHDIKQGLLERLHADGVPVHVHESAGVTPRVLDFGSYTAVSRWLIASANKRADRYPGFVPLDEGMQHHSARVSPSATFVGPVLVGPDVVVGDHAVVVGPTSLGAGTSVGEHAMVARSFLLDGARVGAGASVDASLVSWSVTIRAREEVRDQVRIASNAA